MQLKHVGGVKFIISKLKKEKGYAMRNSLFSSWLLGLGTSPHVQKKAGRNVYQKSLWHSRHKQACSGSWVKGVGL